MNDYYIYTEGMAVGYGGQPLIEDIRIRVRRGEILTLIGPNGAGKSTILKSITKQLGLIAGTVYLEERSMKELSEREISRRMSVVMTERMRPELMTCADVVGTGRYPYTGRLGILGEEDREKVRKAMELVHAAELADIDFMQVSDGQRQRILLARAICQEPEIIILDEPTSFLDIRHKLELLTILRQMVRERQVAVIVSLHELELAQRLSDYVMCVHGSRIERCGTPEEIFTSSYINELYGVTKGTYNALFGCVELERVRGVPKVFVIGGNASASALYRKLQRQGIPFATGVLHENDVDCQTARALAAETVVERAFEAVGEEAYERARELMLSCETVYCTVERFGAMNERCRLLRDEALRTGRLRTEAVVAP